jgi:hypothetical protein
MRLAAAGLVAAVLAACSVTGSKPELTPIPGWTRPLCGPRVAVTSPWDRQIQGVYEKLWQVVRSDTDARDVEVVVVKTPKPEAASSCTSFTGSAPSTTIMVPARWMPSISTWPQPDLIIARILAHELAHLVLHQDPRSAPLDDVTKEYEADELGVYYYETAGFDCLEWVTAINRWAAWGYAPLENERHAVRSACALAKQGQRSPRRAR